jgi:hypothetical protein
VARNSASTAPYRPSANIFCSAQDAIRAEHHVRQPDSSWLMREYSAPSEEIHLAAFDCRLRLESVYERVEFDAAN